jgi:hypothetical protein
MWYLIFLHTLIEPVFPNVFAVVHDDDDHDDNDDDSKNNNNASGIGSTVSGDWRLVLLTHWD